MSSSQLITNPYIYKEIKEKGKTKIMWRGNKKSIKWMLQVCNKGSQWTQRFTAFGSVGRMVEGGASGEARVRSSYWPPPLISDHSVLHLFGKWSLGDLKDHTHTHAHTHAHTHTHSHMHTLTHTHTHTRTHAHTHTLTHARRKWLAGVVRHDAENKQLA